MPSPLNLAEGPRSQILDDFLTSQDKIKLRLVSKGFCDYYNSFFTAFTLPLYSFIREIFNENKPFFSLPENNIKTRAKHLAVLAQFSELFKDYLFSSFKNEQFTVISFNIAQWLKEHNDFLIALGDTLVLPDNFNYQEAQKAVEGEKQEYSHFNDEYFTQNPATRIQKMGYYAFNFKQAPTLERKMHFAEKLCQGILPEQKLSFAQKITRHLIRTLEKKVKVRLNDALKYSTDYNFIAAVQIFCVKEIYNIDIKLSEQQLKNIKEFLTKKIRDLGTLTSSTTIQIYNTSKLSNTGWVIAVTSKQEAEANTLQQALALIGISAKKGKIKNSEEWSVQIKDYFPIELISAHSAVIATESLNI